jgi:hypothetical protein
MHELFVIILFLYYDVSLASKRRAFHFKSDKKRVSTILWSDGPVLAFVSVDVWRGFISCQTFRETGSVGRRVEMDDHQYVFQKGLEELGK